MPVPHCRIQELKRGVRCICSVPNSCRIPRASIGSQLSAKMMNDHSKKLKPRIYSLGIGSRASERIGKKNYDLVPSLLLSLFFPGFRCILLGTVQFARTHSAVTC
ncbi:hypothetical protein GQ55_2G478900 [Panicum hallii var. hallii]|uniref:Uncharacterized protein n=1 Tax=Panicum hallii var. hallii TaxID=1504633 RepID=A0A2T7F0A8_9POAL|nr:hypothetical protein GQ55_2G478900 [Panicum hallii var. hallii]